MVAALIEVPSGKQRYMALLSRYKNRLDSFEEKISIHVGGKAGPTFFCRGFQKIGGGLGAECCERVRAEGGFCKFQPDPFRLRARLHRPNRAEDRATFANGATE